MVSREGGMLLVYYRFRSEYKLFSQCSRVCVPGMSRRLTCHSEGLRYCLTRFLVKLSRLCTVLDYYSCMRRTIYAYSSSISCSEYSSHLSSSSKLSPCA